MSDRATIRQIIERYIAGINSGEVGDIPLTDDVEFRGAMLAEPKIGEATVRQHLADIAPFADMELVDLLVDDDAAAAMIEVRTITGQNVMGLGLFRFRDGAICYHRGFTDTHQLFTGQR
jgi:hypothetical protein